MPTPPRYRENQLFPTPRPGAYPPPSPLPWTPAPAPVPAWHSHAADTSDPHRTRLLVPALRMGSGAPSVAGEDKPTDLYYDISGGALYVCAAVAGETVWLPAGSDSYTKGEVDEKVTALSQSVAGAQSTANSAQSTANSAQSTADQAYGTSTSAMYSIDSHVANEANPHKVTASQVGAYTTTEIDGKLKSFLTGEADPVFTDWRDNSPFLAVGRNVGCNAFFDGTGEPSNGFSDGSVALGDQILVEGQDSYIEHVTLVGSNIKVLAAENSHSNAVVLGHNVLSHGADTFNIGAPSLDKVYLGAYEKRGSGLVSLDNDKARTLQSLLDDRYAKSDSLSGYLPLTGGKLAKPRNPSTDDADLGTVELAPTDGKTGGALRLRGGVYGGGELEVGAPTSYGEPGRIVVGGSLYRPTLDSIIYPAESVEIVGSTSPDPDGFSAGSGADVKIAGSSVRDLFSSVQGILSWYSAVPVDSFDAGEYFLKPANRTVYLLRGSGTDAYPTVTVSLPTAETFSETVGPETNVFDCVLWIELGARVTVDHGLTFLGSDSVYLADGSETKVSKDGMTVVTVTGTKEGDSDPVYLVSVRRFTKLETS